MIENKLDTMQDDKLILRIDAKIKEEIQFALTKDKKLVEFFEISNEQTLIGNIYLGIIDHIEPSIQAVFVDFGSNKNGFLSLNDIHSDYFSHNKKKGEKIQDLLKKGQPILVQVTRDSTPTKGCNLTTFLSLAGTSCVLLPNSENLGGVSKKISGEDRIKLKQFLEEIDPKMSLIIRTAGNFSTVDEIKLEYKALQKKWKKIQAKVKKIENPVLVYKDNDPILRALRAYSKNTLESIEVSSNIFEKIKEYQEKELIKVPEPIVEVKSNNCFPAEIRDQIALIYLPEVDLPSGASIFIHQTEALVSIDVNSKKIKSKSLNKTALNVNLEAADEIANQVILRDLGGLIVVDFIDMNNLEDVQKVNQKIKEAFKKDKASISIIEISKFGLVQISRQRIRSSVLNRSYEACNKCLGSGFYLKQQKIGLNLIRKLLGINSKFFKKITVTLSFDLMQHVLNNFSTYLKEPIFEKIDWQILSDFEGFEIIKN
jgi:ribonuclease E